MRTAAKIFVALAFDHELSLGGTTSYERNLFAPTRELLALAGELHVPIVLFTDVLCAIMHAQWGVPTFVEPYRETIREAILAGHDVQLHIHPHWVTSSWDGKTFVPSHDFGLGDFHDKAPPDDIAGIIERSAGYLRELCREADPSYECIAFRAGGYNLAPATSTILHALYDNGIRIDSSIAKGFYFKSRISTVDYRSVTNSANWFLPLDGPAQAHADQGLFEVPIAGSPRNAINNIPFLARRLLHRRRRHNDSGSGIHEKSTSRSEKFKRLFPKSSWTLSFDNFSDSSDDVFDVLRHHVRAHADEQEIICSSVSHPKSMGSHARATMRGFIERARSEFGEQIKFVTFRDIYNRDLAKQ